MARAPEWKIYHAGKYRAACHELEAALVVADFYGDGATVRSGHTARGTVFTVGTETDGAGNPLRPSESIDECVELVYARLEAKTCNVCNVERFDGLNAAGECKTCEYRREHAAKSARG